MSLPTARYEPLRPLGRGAAGTTLLARDRLEPEKLVALKSVGQDPAQRAQRQMLQQEYRVLADTAHEGLARVLDLYLDEDSDQWIVVREYVEGRELMDATEGLPSETLHDLLAQSLRALGYLHSRGVLHNDLKPANILVREDPESPPRAILIDCGLATTAGEQQSVAGTLLYMPPEKMRREPLDERSDLYAMGVTFYEVVARELPPVVLRGGQVTPHASGAMLPSASRGRAAGVASARADLCPPAPRRSRPTILQRRRGAAGP